MRIFQVELHLDRRHLRSQLSSSQVIWCELLGRGITVSSERPTPERTAPHERHTREPGVSPHCAFRVAAAISCDVRTRARRPHRPCTATPHMAKLPVVGLHGGRGGRSGGYRGRGGYENLLQVRSRARVAACARGRMLHTCPAAAAAASLPECLSRFGLPSWHPTHHRAAQRSMSVSPAAAASLPGSLPRFGLPSPAPDLPSGRSAEHVRQPATQQAAFARAHLLQSLF